MGKPLQCGIQVCSPLQARYLPVNGVKLLRHMKLLLGWCGGFGQCVGVALLTSSTAGRTEHNVVAR